MPSVIVTLIHTPRPEGDRVAINEDIDVWVGADTTICTDAATFVDPAEAIAVAQALILVAGCADTRWRGWHWIAKEANGEELGRTPPGQWYADRDDCLKAISALFGYDVNVTLCNGCHGLNRAAAIAPATPDADPDEYPVEKVEL